ncbi:MAG: ABC transporter permease [Methylobacteriaceae bacterium]|nr:ABC transporter permease [Methylobacteriaceae bacterium]
MPATTPLTADELADEALAPAALETDVLAAEEAAPALSAVRSQTYLSLVGRRFRRNTMGMVGAVLVGLVLLATIFASFLSPYDPTMRNRDAVDAPPQALHFFADDDGFHLIPYTHPLTIEMDPTTFKLNSTEDASRRCAPSLFGRGWAYTLFGISLDRHLLAAPPLDCPWNILGTDRNGRDVLSRLLVGSQLTMLMAAIVVSISVTIGALVGIVSGYFGGIADHWIQRGVEFILALPEIPFYFALVAIIPRNSDPFHVLLLLCAILSALRWAQLAREVRGKTLAIAHLDYVAAAEAVGAGAPRIVVRHILPNVMSHVVVSTTLMIPSVILIESFLSFLGLGVQPPLISWGLLLNAGKDLQNLGSYPWVMSPVVAILIAVMSFNMLGDGLRDAIDPYQH